MDILQIQELIRKYNAGQCMAEEKLSLEQWYLSFEWDATTVALNAHEILELKNEAWQALYKRKQSEEFTLGEQAKVIAINLRKKYRWYAAAAVIFLLIGTGIIYKFMMPTDKPVIVKNTIQQQQADILPGGNKARLMLADGSMITLDSVQSANLNEKDGTQIQKNGGRLVYDAAASKGEEILYNTLVIPRGGEYQLVLPDGSKVWLNAASSLRYPTKFAGNERKVYLTGEAYFEVAPLTLKEGNAKVPFIVKVNTQSGDGGEVEVLGTHFNINSYSDEETVNTTLLKGSVKVNGTDKSILLSPGEQSQLKPGGTLQVVKGINTDEVVAWKEGYFHFESADISTILRQFSRWYDIDVVYAGKIKQRKFFGIVSRSSTLMNVLKMLKANDINFRIEGKKLIVQSE